ncbi:unnamed protein product [Phyllotreta striolata]|uniref:Uncharacterized protein n=1 Tax=Phyllotreta striolata TaxID=444603 RepID=A0A9N9TRF7_PHYSR|nr:unnamed protein product [Phyllotreta striolata]
MLKITSLVLVLCISWASADDDMEARLKRFQAKMEKQPGYEDCLASSGAKKEDIFTFPPSEVKEVGCFMKCLMEKSGVLGADGNINMEKALDNLKQIPPEYQEKAKEAVTKCMEGVKVESCEDVMKIKTCMFQIKHH